MDPKLPRMFGGEISPKYIGVLESAMPKASPDINLDIYSSCKEKKEEIKRALTHQFLQLIIRIQEDTTIFFLLEE